MGIRGNLEAEVDIKSCGFLFYELFGSTPHHVPNISPKNVHACDVHEGDFGKPGSVIQWTYTVDGKKCVTKEIVEAIDTEKKIVRFKVTEGDLLDVYKNFKISVQIIPMGEVTGVKWILEFEKMSDDGPYPTNFMNYLIEVTKDIETHHTQEGTFVQRAT